MRRLRLPLLLVLLAAARPAAAACTARDVMACGPSCWRCVGTTCTLAQLLTVAPPVPGQACTFDFGARDIVLAGGGFTADGNAFEIKAHGLTVGASGTLKASGKRATPGGVILLTLGPGGFTVLATANLIDLTGEEVTGNPVAGGGTFTVFSDGNVTLDGPGIAVDGTTPNAQGGTINLNAGRLSGTTVAASGSVTVRAPLSATAKVNGGGGTVMLTAKGGSGSGKVDVEQTIDVTGGGGGGFVCEASSGDTILGTTPGGKPLVVADGNGDATDGGCIGVTGGGQITGHNGVTDPLSAQGSAAFTTGNDGGTGGMVCLDGAAGLTLGGGINGGINVTAGRSGCGGCMGLTTDDSGADLTLAVPLFAGAAGPDGFAGEIDLAAGGGVILHDDIDASAVNGCGTLCLMALADITLETPAQALHADGPGGMINLCAGRDVVLSSPLVSAAATSSLTGNDGGALCVASNRTTTASGPVDVSAAAPNGGGMIDLEADRDLAIGGPATFNADGGNGGGSGGTISLLAGVLDFPGDLSLSGQAHARGSAPLGALISGSAMLRGCTVHVGATGLLDTRGDPHARNTLVARSGLTVDAGAFIATTGGQPTSRNFVTLPTGAPTPSAAAFSPPLAPGDVTVKPVCTGPNQPPACLVPCPVCGNGQVEYPETCDQGAANGPCQPCNQNCRTFTCDDQNPCTTDRCDPLAGCTHATIPGCTTTTTTLPTTTTTTTSSTSTTSPSVTTTTVIGATTTSLAPTTSTTAAAATTTTTTSTSTTRPPTTTTTASSSTSTTTRPPTPTSSSTTTTTLPTGCAVAPTFTSIDCRLEVLIGTLNAEPLVERVKASLLKQLHRAKARMDSAQGLGRGREARTALGDAVRAVGSFKHLLQSTRVRRILPAAVRANLLAGAGPIRTDLQRLLKSL